MGIDFFGRKESLRARANVSVMTAAAFLAMMNVACISTLTSTQVTNAMGEQRIDNSTGFPRVLEARSAGKKRLGNFGDEEIRKMSPGTLAAFEVGDFYLLTPEQVEIIYANPLQVKALSADQVMGLLNAGRGSK